MFATIVFIAMWLIGRCLGLHRKNIGGASYAVFSRHTRFSSCYSLKQQSRELSRDEVKRKWE
jgi:hypothetical protein